MENNNKGYKFYGDYNTVTVEQEFLMKLVNKNLNDIFDELSFVASYLHSIIINDNDSKTLVIYGTSHYSVLKVLLVYFEWQLTSEFPIVMLDIHELYTLAGWEGVKTYIRNKTHFTCFLGDIKYRFVYDME